MGRWNESQAMGVVGQRKKRLVQQLEMGICPGSVQGCGSAIKSTVKFGIQQKVVVW